MKTLIIAFWLPDQATGGESGNFRMHKSMLGLIEEGVTCVAFFKDEHFKENRRMTEESKIKFIKDFIFDQFLITKCQVMIVAMNEILKDSFLKRIGYHKTAVRKSEPAPAISGKAFSEEDKIFVYLQDKKALGFFPLNCYLEPVPGTDMKILRIFSHVRFN